MSKLCHPGFFDISTRVEKLTKLGNHLVLLEGKINWEAFRPELGSIYEKERKSNAGAKPYDVVMMFKLLILQQLYNLADEGIEYQISDRLSFMRFLGFNFEDKIPDARTVWLFRERLKELGLVAILFRKFDDQLAAHGFVAKSGQMIDATFVEAPRQRNNRGENEIIKAGGTPEEWQSKPAKLSQKDCDARWAKKGNETHYGYKNHVNADSAEKFIQNYEVTDASVHDSQVVDPILDITTIDENGKKRSLYADSAYRSIEQEEKLKQAGIESYIHEKGARNCPLTEEQKESNHIKSKTRIRVEHVFAAQTAMGGIIVRTIGIERAKVKIGLMNLAYNMKRLLQVTKRNAAKLAKKLIPAEGIIA